MYFICVYMHVHVLYRYVLFALVCACSYLYIFTYRSVLIGNSLDCILYLEVPSHCIIIYNIPFIYTEKFVY